MKWNIDISYMHYNYSVKRTYFYILWYKCILNDTWIPAHSLPQKIYFVYLKKLWNIPYINFYKVYVYLISKGLVAGKIVRLAAGLHHYLVSFA